jgi:hypothetical protein
MVYEEYLWACSGEYSVCLVSSTVNNIGSYVSIINLYLNNRSKLHRLQHRKFECKRAFETAKYSYLF